jgi:RNA polymerase sigma-70 factor (ECF subfamily)
MIGQEEHEVVRRARTGDRQAFDSLYRMHVSRVRATVAARARDRDDVDDLVQVAFIRAFEGMPTFRGDAALSTWLTRIAHNVCNSHHQAEGARRRALEAVAQRCADRVGGWARAEPEMPDRLLGRKEARSWVIRAILSLPTRCREAMWLRYVRDYSYAEIQAELCVPSGTVKTWLWRGRTLLKTRLHDGTDGAGLLN